MCEDESLNNQFLLLCEQIKMCLAETFEKFLFCFLAFQRSRTSRANCVERNVANIFSEHPME